MNMRSKEDNDERKISLRDIRGSWSVNISSWTHFKKVKQAG